MAKWKGITADELIVLRKIERVNYQIRQIAEEFGTSSLLYQHYENFLTSTRKNTLADGGLIRETKSGVLQISVSKQAVREIGAFTAYEKALNRIGSFKTVGQQKQHMLQAYQKRTGQELETAADKRSAYKKQKAYEKEYETINDVLHEYYKLEKQVGKGKEFVSHDKLRALSEGSGTDPENLKKMVKIAQKELKQKRHSIKKQYDDYLKGL